ncbi:2-dehydropantoate 2-reductase [Pseudomonas sp. NFXW11]|uniref:ketopantoate reductase family protein n=1 Tax=Pseudomonas sp. NFXW11 TaxID=2819531 RepID=UPI003CF2A4F2
MNISILGAGAMGSLFGGLLAESGQQVTLLDINDRHLQAIHSRGLSLETDAGQRYVHGLGACRPEQASGQPDLLLVFTKTLHTDSALRSVAGHIGPQTWVLTLQNGLGNAETLSRHVPASRVVIGMTNWPADLLGPGQVRSHGLGEVRIMGLQGHDDGRVAQVAAVLDGAGLHCAVDREVWSAIWEKVAFNAALNSLCAASGCTVGQLDGAPEGLALARSIVLEVLAVAQAQGVAVDRQRCLDAVSYAIAHHRTHKPSMLQDVLAGRPTEIASINGEVLARARQAGIAVPHNETLLGLLRLIEARQRRRVPSL